MTREVNNKKNKVRGGNVDNRGIWVNGGCSKYYSYSYNVCINLELFPNKVFFKKWREEITRYENKKKNNVIHHQEKNLKSRPRKEDAENHIEKNYTRLFM